MWGPGGALSLLQQPLGTDVSLGPWEDPSASLELAKTTCGAVGPGSQALLGPQGRGTKHYGLIVVGHSLGAGTAAILSFLLRPQYPTLKCFAYSPPGGLLR